MHCRWNKTDTCRPVYVYRRIREHLQTARRRRELWCRLYTPSQAASETRMHSALLQPMHVWDRSCGSWWRNGSVARTCTGPFILDEWRAIGFHAILWSFLSARCVIFGQISCRTIWWSFRPIFHIYMYVYSVQFHLSFVSCRNHFV